jgi:hypothetical protein
MPYATGGTLAEISTTLLGSASHLKITCRSFFFNVLSIEALDFESQSGCFIELEPHKTKDALSE